MGHEFLKLVVSRMFFNFKSSLLDLLSNMHQTLYASMIKMSYHPDLATLNQFEKLILALGRWPQFFTISLAISDTEISGGFCQGNLFKGYWQYWHTLWWLFWYTYLRNTDKKYFRRILLVSKTFPALEVQNCLKLAI